MPDDSSERWRRISALFEEAIQLPAPQRAAFLDAACGSDPELKAEVVRLLQSAEQAEGFLEQPLFSQAGPLLRQAFERIQATPTDPSPGNPTEASTLTASSSATADLIGPYGLVRKLGEGGMGEVWLAEQTEPVRRQVALKLIKAGMDMKQVIARFEAERQALALMDHPAIAKVYEAGQTPRGFPYFAMELVAGEPITAYCDRHRLGMSERLDLFERVCDGVQHAHQKGVIHRDLKPSNILVAIQDDQPVPKIIDFGVAKATAQRLTERSMFTEQGVLIGTPEYMSPEQAEMTGLDVDTRTDVYALGVILYELLTGALPFEPRELRRAGYDEIRRLIREVDPPRPSTRISTLGEKATDAAKNRRLEPKQLAGRLRRDLDWVVMKALEKDRTRRYGSAADLAAEVGRYLRHEPVAAGPPSATYRARKFVRRHRFGVSVAGLAILGTVTFGVAMAVQARRIALQAQKIAQERDRAERVSNFLVDLFKVSDPSEARGNSILAREVLDRGSERIYGELQKEAALQAQLMQTMGLVYMNLGLLEKGERLLSDAAEVRRRTLGAEHPETLESMQWWGWALCRRGRYPEAEKVLRDVLEIRRLVLGPEHADTAHSKATLAMVYKYLGRHDEAEELWKQALENRRRALGPEDPETLKIMSNLAICYEDQRRYEEGAKLERQVFEIQRRVLGRDHPHTLESEMVLATLSWRLNRSAEAESLAREVLDIQRRVLGPEHPGTLMTMHSLANALSGQSRYAEAETLDRETLDIQRRVLGPDQGDTLDTMDNLADDLLQQGRLDEAERLRLDVLDAQLRKLGPTSLKVAFARYQLACVAARRGTRSRALDWLRQAIQGGYADPSLEKDPDLASLRGSPEFERLGSAARENARKAHPGAP
jgi:non-specific serine/threonine protein kinase/serine/threonine-protein kinase